MPTATANAGHFASSLRKKVDASRDRLAIISIMNAGNVILTAVAVALGGFVWMVTDATSGKASRSGGGGGTSAASLSSAIASGQPVLLEFYADWCGPCKMVGPQVDELAVELKGRARVVRLNVDQHPALAQQYGVRGIPAFIAIKGGRETSRVSGAIDKASMRGMLGM